MKLSFLSQERKIIPKELLQEVEHFSSLINSFRYGRGDKAANTEIAYMPDVYAEDEYCQSYQYQDEQNACGEFFFDKGK